MYTPFVIAHCNQAPSASGGSIESSGGTTMTKCVFTNNQAVSLSSYCPLRYVLHPSGLSCEITGSFVFTYLAYEPF
jgi:hypothetical protein